MSLVAGDTTRRARARPNAVPAVAAAPVAVATTAEQSAPKRRRLAMNFHQINKALREAMKKPPPSPSSSDGTVFVCHATKVEWDAFTVSEDPAPAFKTNYLEWFEATNAIHIIEFPPHATHDRLVLALHKRFHTSAVATRWLDGRGGCADDEGWNFAPDLNYGPVRTTPGTVLPRNGMPWSDFNTIKVEVGVSQRWGDRPGQLDYKAVRVWAATLGVEYVLCIKTNDDYSLAEFKLYNFHVRDNQGNVVVAVQPNATPIVEGTTIAFDAHRILGIPAGLPLPTIPGPNPANLPGFPPPLNPPALVFPDPYVVDLFAAFQEVRQSL